MEPQPNKKVSNVSSSQLNARPLFRNNSETEISLALSYLARMNGVPSIPVSYIVEEIPDSNVLRILAIIAGPMTNEEIAAMTADDKVKLVAMVDPLSEFLQKILEKAGVMDGLTTHSVVEKLGHVVTAYATGLATPQFLAAAEAVYREQNSTQRPPRFSPGH